MDKSVAEPHKSNHVSTPANRWRQRHDFPQPTRLARYFTVWWWEEGPITKGSGPQELYFWERLQSAAPKDAQPYCCYLNTIIFYSDRSHGKELCREETYGLSFPDTIIGDTRASAPPIFYQVASGKVVWRDGHWWMRWNAYKNTRIARMLNFGWPKQ